MPLIAADVAFVVCHVTSAVVLFWSVAVICAVGAGAVVGVTVALAVAVRPSAARPTSVKVVCPVTVTDVEPLRVTAVAVDRGRRRVGRLPRDQRGGVVLERRRDLRGGGGAVVGVTVALAVAVRLSAARATSVKVVCPVTATDVEPLRQPRSR